MAFYEKHKPSQLEGKSSLRTVPRVPPGTVDPGASCACPQPQPALCTWLSICKQWLRVNSLSFVLLGPQGDTQSPTYMKRVNETQVQSNYSPAITERGSQNQDWAAVQLSRGTPSREGGVNPSSTSGNRGRRSAPVGPPHGFPPACFGDSVSPPGT